MKSTLGPEFKLVDGRIVKDEAARLAKLPLPKRIAAAKGKKTGVKVAKPQQGKSNGIY